MNILLLGKKGQVGWELQRSLRPLGNVVSLDRHSDVCGDLTNLNGLSKTIRALRPDVIVNAAAYTAVDEAESESEIATLINATAPACLAQECLSLDALLIHYSSDYVFDGTGSTPWQEDCPKNPLNHYGKSKWDGDQAIINSGCKHIIFRTSWVYSAQGNNFIKTILRLARQQKTLSIVADQIGAPTEAKWLADVTSHTIPTVISQPELGGVYHLVPLGETSWYNYAHFIVAQARTLGAPLSIQEIAPILSTNYITPAKRPLNSRLDCTKFENTFAIHRPDWEPGVIQALNKICGTAWTSS